MAGGLLLPQMLLSLHVQEGLFILVVVLHAVSLIYCICADRDQMNIWGQKPAAPQLIIAGGECVCVGGEMRVGLLDLNRRCKKEKEEKE